MDSPNSVFRDESILLQELLPHQIPHLQAELRKLEFYFQEAMQNPSEGGRVVLLTGPVGSGTLELARKLVLESLPKKAAQYGNSVRTLHVNCRVNRSLQAVMEKALKTLGQSSPPPHGHSFDDLLRALVGELRNNRTHLMIVLDEADFLIAADFSALATITNLVETAKGNISLLLISKTLDYLKSVDLSTLSSLKWPEVKLRPYDSVQIEDVIVSRRTAFKDGCLGESSVRLAARIASQYGDARYALSLIHEAGKVADSLESPQVLSEHILSARTLLKH